MTLSEPTNIVSGSERPVRPGYTISDQAEFDSPVRIVLKLRARTDVRPAAMRLGMKLPRERAVPDQKEFVARFGADPRDVATVRAFAHAFGLRVESHRAAARIVVLTGSISAVNRAFATDLKTLRASQGGPYRGYLGPLRLPAEMRDAVDVVAGLDDRTIAVRPPLSVPRVASPYQIAEIACRYGFPRMLRGDGQRIAVLQFDGAYSQLALDRYFGDLGTTSPRVCPISIGGYAYDDPKSAMETMLDLEVLGSVAPRAELVPYFAYSTEAGWLESLTSAIHSERHAPSIISISHCYPESGAPGLTWVPSLLDEVDRTLAEAAWLGITVVAAAGDYGAYSWLHDGLVHAEFPASSPFVLACGGTMFRAGDDGAESELVWQDPSHATGGGVSEHFPRPAWQASARVPPSLSTKFEGRGVPDVAAYADLEPGYAILVAGAYTAGGGTSAATPLWAALFALINERLEAICRGRTVGYVTPLLYYGIGLTAAFNDIEGGGNNGYAAGPDWDPCTGWGSPNGAELLRALTGDQ